MAHMHRSFWLWASDRPVIYCPAYAEFNETELQQLSSPLTPCCTCPGANSNCSAVVNQVLTAHNIPRDQNATYGWGGIADEALSYCEELCESNKEGESCSQDDHCTPGTPFSDYKAADAEFKNGTCKPFPTNLEECVKEGFVAWVEGKKKCVDCRLRSVFSYRRFQKGRELWVYQQSTWSNIIVKRGCDDSTTIDVDNITPHDFCDGKQNKTIQQSTNRNSAKKLGRVQIINSPISSLIYQSID